jgi:hypothetical protein
MGLNSNRSTQLPPVTFVRLHQWMHSPWHMFTVSKRLPFDNQQSFRKKSSGWMGVCGLNSGTLWSQRQATTVVWGGGGGGLCLKVSINGGNRKPVTVTVAHLVTGNVYWSGKLYSPLITNVVEFRQPLRRHKCLLGDKTTSPHSIYILQRWSPA